MQLRPLVVAVLGFLALDFARGQGSAPPDHLNLGGLCGLSSEITGASGRVVYPIIPVGDIDGDGKDDLLFRNHSAAYFDLPEDLVVLLYGQPFPDGELDVFAPGVRRTVFTPGRFDPKLEWRLSREGVGIAGGEDIDGDRRPDFLVASGFEARVDGPAIVLILGAAGGGPLPGAIHGNMIGNELRGSFITERNVHRDRLIGEGLAVSPDINGDGLAEILIVESKEIWRKRCFVLFGSRDLPAAFDVSEIGSRLPGFVVETNEVVAKQGETGFRVPFDAEPPGGWFSPMGDVDGDGLSELGFVTMGNRSDPVNGIFAGASFILFGRREFPSTVVLDEIAPGEGIILPRHEGLASGGDVDGDGFGEAILFYPTSPLLGGEEISQARIHLLFGRPGSFLPPLVNREVFEAEGLGTTIDLHPQGVSDGSEGMRAPFAALTGGSDLDGDGRTEIVLGHWEHVFVSEVGNLHKSGSVFILRGSNTLPPELSLDTVCQVVRPDRCAESADSIARGFGTRLDGAERLDKIGKQVHVLEDFDGDGTADFLIVTGESRASRSALLVSGKALEHGTPPRLGRVLPSEGPVSGGNTVLLFGMGFTANTTARFGGVPAEIVEVRTGILTVKAPPGGLALPVEVTVATEIGETAGCGVSYTYRSDSEGGITIGGAAGRSLAVLHPQSEKYLSMGIAALDFTGDGKVDLAVIDRAATGVGVTHHLHLVRGQGRRATDEVDLDALAPPAGATILAGDDLGIIALVGTTPLGRGDLNGDGAQDLLLKVRDRLQGLDEWRIVLGREDIPDQAGLDALPRVVRLASSESRDLLGAASIVSDVSGDGKDDLLVSLLRDSRTELFVVKGGPELEVWGLLGPTTFEELVADGRAGQYSVDLSLESTAGGAGDVNGDGLADLYFAGSGVIGEGAMALIYGDRDLFTGAPVKLENAFGDRRGLLIIGDEFFAGQDLCALVPGDLDGDGRPELFFRKSSSEQCQPSPCSGLGFVFDRDTVLREGFFASDALGIAGLYAERAVGLPDFAAAHHKGVLRVRGGVRGEGMGASASPAGDFNGDGFGDLLLGNRRISTFEATSNTCYVLWGGPDLDSLADLDLTQSNGRAVVIRASGALEFGKYVDGEFDWDADGIDDVVIGSANGRADLVFGERRSETEFVRGDGNGDSVLDVSDAVSALGYLFLGSRPPSCLDAIDLDDNGDLEISDPIYLLAYLFLSGPAPAPPHPLPGLDTTPDAFRCVKN